MATSDRVPLSGMHQLPALILASRAATRCVRDEPDRIRKDPMLRLDVQIQFYYENEVAVDAIPAHLSRHRSVSMSSDQSSKAKSRSVTLSELGASMPVPAMARDFEPCAATASMFLYAQGNSAVCAHHDTLKIERRFSRHTEDISLLAVDTPRFTILHNLTTSRGPSPIVTLAWHASSSRQKSDMLATQTNDGDLRVWSIAKSPTSNDTAKVVRVLKRTENFQTGPNWLGWSKNGRIVQGLAVYGPGATLFTLGQSNTVQQFDLNSPCQLVANVQHPANLLPPSPPVSIEEQRKQTASSAPSAIEELSAVPINLDISESDEDHMSPLAKIAREMDKLEMDHHETDRADTLSPVSSRSHASTTSRSSAGSRTPYRKHSSAASRGMSDGTTMSTGSSFHSTREPSVASSRDSLSMSSMSSQSNTSGRSRPRGSRLRQEVLRSPDDPKIVDLFKFTKTRLSDIPYRHPQILDNSRLTNHDLRRQMLSTIFGWDGDAPELIQDEMSRHPKGSPNRLLLAKWLGDIDTDIMATSSESMTSSDWMLLALSGIGGHASQTKVARAYVQRLLEKGDVHTAATIMIGMGDQNDAIEIYVSHKRYMEALILVCLVFPTDWQRQTELIRKWGEWAVQHSQHQLAIRCFSCTATESSEPWVSPTAPAATFSRLQGMSIPEMLSPPLSPPGGRGPQRSIAKTSALKLITSFGDNAGRAKFFGLGDDERTPIGGGVTPIAESALSPSGGDTAHTAFLRPGNRSAYHTPASARTATPGGFSRQRLPSIGEMPSDVVPRRELEPATLPTPVDSGSDKQKSERPAVAHERKSSQPETMQLNSATYVPLNRAATAKLSVASSRARTATNRSLAGSATSHSTAANRSPLTSERSYRSMGTASPVVTGRSLDQYISSLESAQHHAEKQRRQASKDRDRTGRAGSGSRKLKARELSEDRGRSAARFIKPAKRSPTSPIPMSPEDLRDLGAGREGSLMRSPSSPLPMSPQTKFYQAVEVDECEGSKQVRSEQKRFRSRQRDNSRLRERGTSAVRDPSPDRRRRDRSSKERRKSLVRRPSAPPIVHPEELVQLSPMQYRASPSLGLARSSISPPPKPPMMQLSRSQTTSPVTVQTSPAHPKEPAERSSMQIGLPATPRAMRHPKYDSEGRYIPDVPQIPGRYEHAQPSSWGTSNAMTYNNALDNLAHLPKTTYHAAPRRLLPRSASAPIPEEPPNSPQALPAALPLHPAFHAALPPSSRRKTQDPIRVSLLPPRKINPGESQPGTLGYETQNSRPSYAIGLPGLMSGIDETIEASSQPLNPSNDNLTPPPPPPPPAPPILKELQHLATPPPPPPAPVYRPHDPNTNSIVSGVSQGSGVIEIVMDDDDEKSQQTIIDVPAAPQHVQRTPPTSHNRGRSESDNSITGRFNRAAERLRSVSRGKNGASPNLDRARSPGQPESMPQTTQSPYESVPTLWSPSRHAAASPSSIERHPREVKAAMNMQGGMI
ncbi:WD g-beta repeat protein [Diplocarpon rosae]|nr:WD g-beta repeat protein [Diplocarpon rosae]